MKEKNIKFIMELIFIFILPLVFILPCIKLKDNYVYDNEGNYQVSEKVVEFQSPLDLGTNIIESKSFPNVRETGGIDKTYSFEWLGNHLYNSNIDFTYLNTYAYIHFLDSNEQDLFTIECYLTLSLSIGGWVDYTDDHLADVEIDIDLSDPFDSTYLYWISDLNSSENNAYFNFADFIYSLDSFAQGIGDLVSDIAYIYFNDECYTLDFYTDTYDVVTDREYLNVFGKIKQVILSALDIESNTAVDFILTYTFLWLIMFMIWHFVYRLIDFVVHCYDRVARRKE